MDQYVFFAIAAVILSIIRYGTYLHTIYRGDTKPHAFTWFLLGTVTCIGAAAQLYLGGGPSAWVLAFTGATCLSISGLAVFIGERNYKTSDWVTFFTALCAIPLWVITDNPFYAMILIILIDGLSMFPTIRKSYNKPHTEPPISSFIAGVRYICLILSVSDPTWQTLIYPIFLLCVDWGFALYLVIRRWQLGYPLHEYAKKST